MANSANNQSHLKQQIRELNHQYKEALQKGEEFGKLKEIRDKIKEMKRQLYTDTESSQPDTEPDIDIKLLQPGRIVQSM